MQRVPGQATEDHHEAHRTLYFSEGTAILKDQLRDYQYRGIGLSSMNMLDFVLNTYEGKVLNDPMPMTGNKRRSDGMKAVGRPPSE